MQELRRRASSLKVNAPGDMWEQEADRIAERVTRAPRPSVQRSCGCGGACDSCKSKTAEAPQAVHDMLRSAGQPLPSQTRKMMESRFGHDFSRVRVHTDGRAAEAARSVHARAYTVARDVVFGAGEYSPGTTAGQQLLAHELAHVVQQSHGGPRVQRQEFVGGPGKTAKDKDRPLLGFSGPMTEQKSPGGTVVPGTAGTGQNCAGDSCSINKFINWPYLGTEIPGVVTSADFKKAQAFVPSGCTRVNCTGIDVYNTRCKPEEREIITFLYQWPVEVIEKSTGAKLKATRSDFHMMGRDAGGLPAGWHSKMDKREKVVDIRSPEQSLFDAYPHTMLKDRTIVKLCFCCDQKAITTT
jgi:Domain of unknown function (DUF4157)